MLRFFPVGQCGRHSAYQFFDFCIITKSCSTIKSHGCAFWHQFDTVVVLIAFFFTVDCQLVDCVIKIVWKTKNSAI